MKKNVVSFQRRALANEEKRGVLSEKSTGFFLLHFFFEKFDQRICSNNILPLLKCDDLIYTPYYFYMIRIDSLEPAAMRGKSSSCM
jgi:hypothetical protein